MNRKQLQLSVCKALLDRNKRCCGTFINDEEFAFTFDGFSAFVFHKDECIFDVSKVRKFETLKMLLQGDEKDIEIKPTKEMFLVNNRVIEKYASDDATLEVFVYADISKFFKEFHFYAYTPHERILVKDDFGRLVGLFLPMRYNG